MMQVTLTLPESIGREAEAAGLLRPEALETLLREEIRRRGRQSFAPDTDRSASAQQMAQGWDAISRPILEDDALVTVDPDDYPLF